MLHGDCLHCCASFKQQVICLADITSCLGRAGFHLASCLVPHSCRLVLGTPLQKLARHEKSFLLIFLVAMPFFRLAQARLLLWPRQFRHHSCKDCAPLCKMCSCDLLRPYPLAETFTVGYLFVAELQHIYFQTKTFLPLLL